jgi:hypothetical protein
MVARTVETLRPVRTISVRTTAGPAVAGAQNTALSVSSDWSRGASAWIARARIAATRPPYAPGPCAHPASISP